MCIEPHSLQGNIPNVVENISKDKLLNLPFFACYNNIADGTSDFIFMEKRMKLKIAENIRKLRHNLNLSQEQLAERLGVRFQAVSKWERGETYPDIELLPSIASFFGISVDELLGTNEIEENIAVEKIVETLRMHDFEKDYGKLIEVAEEGLTQFPNNHLLMAWIVYSSSKINPERSIELGEYVVSNCKNQSILNWVNTELCYAYFYNGEKEKAITMARSLPLKAQSRNDVMRDLLEGGEQVKYILSSIIAKQANDFQCSIQKLLPHYTCGEQFVLMEKCIAFVDVLFESDDDLASMKQKADIYLRMAKLHVQNNENDKAIECLQKAVKCAEKHDKYPYGTLSSSILRSCKKYNYEAVTSSPTVHPYQKLKETLVESIKSDDDFAVLTSVPKFNALLGC